MYPFVLSKGYTGLPLLRSEQSHDYDVELLKAVAAHDEAGERALGQLYDRYRLILFSVLVRILNNREEAEDVLQEVFLQVWRRAADFDATRGRPFTWLVTLARSRGIDRLRSVASRERVAAMAGADEASDEVSDAATDAIRSQQRGVVNNALSQLPEEQKRPLMLAYFDGLTQSEIATQLGAPLGTVKTRMRSGMMKLRELLRASGQYFD